MKTSTILVAEDDPTDAFLLQWAFKTAQAKVTADYVRDGQEAIDYLQGRSRLRQKHLPDTLPELLVLDLKMPRMGGFEVLEWLGHCPELRPPNVVVFSSSFTPEDIHRASLCQVDHYFVKPTDVVELVAMVKRLEPYWGGTSKKAGAVATASPATLQLRPELRPTVCLAV